MKLAVKLLGKYSLPENAPQLLESCLEVSNNLQNYNIWSIATEHGFENFRHLAWMFLEMDSPSKLSVGIMFAKKHFLSNDDKQKFINLLIVQLDTKLPLLPNASHSIWYVLETLILLGEHEYCAGILSDIINEHIPIYFERMPEFNARFRSNEKKPKEEIENWEFYDMKLPCLIIEAEKVKHYLETEVIASLVGMDSQCSQKGFREAHANLLQTLPTEILDDHIDKIQYKEIKIDTLGAIASSGLTQKRMQMILNVLPITLTNHMFNTSIIEFITHYWNDAFIEAFISAVANHPWDDISSQMFHNVRNAVGGKITAEQSQKYIDPIISTITNAKALHFLRLWRDVANEPKI